MVLEENVNVTLYRVFLANPVDPSPIITSTFIPVVLFCVFTTSLIGLPVLPNSAFGYNNTFPNSALLVISILGAIVNVPVFGVVAKPKDGVAAKVSFKSVFCSEIVTSVTLPKTSLILSALSPSLIAAVNFNLDSWWLNVKSEKPLPSVLAPDAPSVAITSFWPSIVNSTAPFCIVGSVAVPK